MTQEEMNMTAIKNYGLPKNANQQEINEVIVKSEKYDQCVL